MKKNVKKIVSLLLTCVMFVGILTACGAQKEEQSSQASTGSQQAAQSSEVASSVQPSEEDVAEGITYPLETDTKFTIAIVNDAAISAISKDINNTPFAKAYAEQTGVDIEFMVLEDFTAMQLLFTDGELPDLVFFRPFVYAGGPEAAVADGVIDPISFDELAEFAPDYLDALNNATEGVMETVLLSDGKVAGMWGFMNDASLRQVGGLVIRQDFLDKAGLEIPNTLAELEEVLRTFKDMGIEQPVGFNSLDGILWYGLWTSPFGLVNTEEYQIDGTVHCGFAEAGYKDLLAWCKKMYDEGLLTADSIQNGVYDGKIGMWHGSLGGTIGTQMAAMEKENPEFNLAGVPSIVLNEGDRALGGQTAAPVSALCAWITPDCQDRELALQFLNYGYTEAGHNLFNFGVEGESYTMVDGYPTYTELITNNPDGLTMQQAMAQYNRAAVGNGPFIQSPIYGEQYFGRPQQRQASDAWKDNDGLKYCMPAFTIAEEDASEYARILADIDTYKAEMRTKFITGEVSLDDFDSVYIKTLKDMGLERYIEIIQDACDAFYAKGK